MRKNDKTIEKLSSLRIKSIGLDEPPADFTLKVMKVIAEEQPVYLVKQRSYWWMLSLVPVLVAIGYYFTVELTGNIHAFLLAILNILKPIGSNISSFFLLLKSIHIPSTFFLGFLAILFLLTIEEMINKLKHKSAKEI